VDETTVEIGCWELQRGASSVPGRVIVQTMNRIAAGEESGWHTHPGEEVGFVLTGTVHLWIRGGPTLFLHAGDFFLIPNRTPHNALAIGRIAGRLLSTYIVEAGRPLSTLVEGGPDC
jgi:quercetin dioxygenase-like cupin family protein